VWANPTGKEEDVEVGLTYFGKRYLNTSLQRWVSADPLEVHGPGEADANLYAYVSGQALKNTDPLGLREQSQDEKDRRTADYQQGQVDGRIATEAAIELDHDVRAAEGWRGDRYKTLARAIHDPDLRAEKKTAVDAEFNKRIEAATDRYDAAVESVLARQHAMPQESNRETYLYQKGVEAGARGAVIDDAISREVGKMVLTSLATGGIGGAFRLAAGIRSAVLARSTLSAGRGGGRPTYVPTGPDGNPLPLPRGPNGELAPSSPNPHTQIGWQEGRRGGYAQTREFGPNGQPLKQVDWTNHRRPAQHSDPHVHDYIPNPTGGTPQHGPARAPRPGEL
jgi:RHS repeat-associated protein